jgi:hypothetical protein
MKNKNLEHEHDLILAAMSKNAEEQSKYHATH